MRDILLWKWAGGDAGEDDEEGEDEEAGEDGEAGEAGEDDEGEGGEDGEEEEQLLAELTCKTKSWSTTETPAIAFFSLCPVLLNCPKPNWTLV